MTDKLYHSGWQLDADWENTHGAFVGVVMGSRSDWEPCMQHCCAMLGELRVPFECGVVSAHRTPERMSKYGAAAAARGLQVIIACAGGSAHLPGMLASETTLPVIGVAPVKGDDAAMYSMVRMPSGVPLSFAGFGKAGAENAALFAVRMLALMDQEVSTRLIEFMAQQTADVPFTCIPMED